jgi:hypothetical protein
MNPVLSYGPKAEHDHDRSNRVYLVWPAAAWRVVAPQPTERHLNLLQKAVLGFCRSASYPAAEIAARLHLHPRLIEAVGMELVRSGWVNQDNWRPTAKGLAMLEGEETQWDAVVSGWVFQDPWTGELWPYFARQWHLQATAAAAQSTRIDLFLETAKGSTRVAAWTPCGPQTSGQPTSEAILAAVLRSRRRERLKASMRFYGSGIDDLTPELPPNTFKRITFIGDQPEPVGLVTFAYIPRAGAGEPQICDPFGFGCAPSLWGQLQQIAHSDEGASAAVLAVRRWMGAKDAPALEEQLRRQRQNAESYIIERLSLDVTTFAGVFGHLADVQQHLSLADAAGGDPQGMLAPAVSSCRKTLEAALKEVARQSPLTNADNQLTGDAKRDRLTVQSIAAAVGFSAPLPDKLRDSIQGENSANNTKKRVKEIAKDLKNVYSLQAALIATLLACQTDAAHPLRRAAKRSPDLLAKFASILESGNPASHDESHSARPKRFTATEAAQVRDLTLEVVASLLNLPLGGNLSYGEVQAKIPA